MACKDAKDFDGAVKLFEDCAEQYMVSGSIDTAVMTIDKAGKILESGYPDKAVEVSGPDAMYALHVLLGFSSTRKVS